MEKVFYNAFNLVPNTGPSKFRKIIDYFESAEKAWKSKPNEFEQIGVKKSWINDFEIKRSQINPPDEIKKLEKENIQILTWTDQKYPKRLKEIFDPPFIIYLKGEIVDQDEMGIAVVGSRKVSPYGQQVIDQFAPQLVRNGFTIISGLAYGSDTLAHQAAIESGGRTIAVIGSGLDKQSIYPSQNRILSEKIARNGAVISEYPFGALALPHHFPSRNRIISGLSMGVLIVEARARSGTLITASHALSQNREVFAVPGSIYWPNSEGTNKLINQGAKLVQNINDIFEELHLKDIFSQVKEKAAVGASPEEKVILEILSKDPVHIDKIIKNTNLKASEANVLLSQMELSGRIKNLGGMNFVKL